MRILIFPSTLAFLDVLTFLIVVEAEKFGSIARSASAENILGTKLVRRTDRKQEASRSPSQETIAHRQIRNPTGSNPQNHNTLIVWPQSPANSVASINQRSESVAHQDSFSSLRTNSLQSSASSQGESDERLKHALGVVMVSLLLAHDAVGILDMRRWEKNKAKWASTLYENSCRTAMAEHDYRSNRAQAAIHIRGGKGQAKLEGLGLNTRVSVDAEESRYGGAIEKVSHIAQTAHMIDDIPPYTKSKFKYFRHQDGGPKHIGIQTSLIGKGALKINSMNARGSGLSADENSIGLNMQESSKSSGSLSSHSLLGSIKSRRLERRSSFYTNLIKRSAMQRSRSPSPNLGDRDSHNQTPEIWTTDPNRGWQSNRKSHAQSISPPISPTPRLSVEVKAYIKGPAAVRTTTSDHRRIRDVYHVAAGRKKFYKLRVKVDMGPQAKARLSNSGRKSHISVETNFLKNDVNLASLGPGARRKEALLPEVIEDYVLNNGDTLQRTPPIDDANPHNTRFQWSIKTVAHADDQDDMVETTGAVRNREDCKTSGIRTVVSNSPPHSPPSSLTDHILITTRTSQFSERMVSNDRVRTPAETRNSS